jgi:hypothetical protein
MRAATKCVRPRVPREMRQKNRGASITSAPCALGGMCDFSCVCVLDALRYSRWTARPPSRLTCGGDVMTAAWLAPSHTPT